MSVSLLTLLLFTLFSEIGGDISTGGGGLMESLLAVRRYLVSCSMVIFLMEVLEIMLDDDLFSFSIFSHSSAHKRSWRSSSSEIRSVALWNEGDMQQSAPGGREKGQVEATKSIYRIKFIEFSPY